MREISYQLAKKLKEAEFPGSNHWTYHDVDTKEENWIDDLFPTLSELIEACGEGFFKLKRCQSDQWETETREEWGTCGSTPEEAVVNLWIALKKSS